MSDTTEHIHTSNSNDPEKDKLRHDKCEQFKKDLGVDHLFVVGVTINEQNKEGAIFIFSQGDTDAFAIGLLEIAGHSDSFRKMLKDVGMSIVMGDLVRQHQPEGGKKHES